MRILLTERQVKDIFEHSDFLEVLHHYYYDGTLTVKSDIFKDKEQKEVFESMLKIVDELKIHGINSDDFTNVHNLGYNKHGFLCYFDIGYGDYFENFEVNPPEIELAEADLGIDAETIQRIIGKYTKNETILLGDGGANGAAYDLMDGTVLKITKDKTEAINSNKIINKEVKHLAKIYDVKTIGINDVRFYIIHLEKLVITKKLIGIFNAINKTIIKNQNNNLDYGIIGLIGQKHPVVAEFLRYIYEFGRAKTWDKYGSFVDQYPEYDFNEISDISEWILGSATNDNWHTDEVPQNITDIVMKLLQNQPT